MKKLKLYIGNMFSSNLALIIVVSVVALCIVFLTTGTRSDDGSITLDGSKAKYSESQEKALCEFANKRDAAVSAIVGVDAPQDSASGCNPTDIAQMGSMPYYKVDVSTPDSFYSAVNGKGFNEGYGLQCVAGFKEFMFSLSGKYIATSTGGAKGYQYQIPQIEALGFKWHNGRAGLQNGDWAIFNDGVYGHVAMYYNGKWFGQNQQGGDVYAGSVFAANLSSSWGNVTGYFRPNIYHKSAPTATVPTPNPVSNNPNNTQPMTPALDSGVYVTQSGDTLGGIALNNGWHGSVKGLYGNSGYAQRLADQNGIEWRGLIHPGQEIKRIK